MANETMVAERSSEQASDGELERDGKDVSADTIKSVSEEKTQAGDKTSQPQSDETVASQTQQKIEIMPAIVFHFKGIFKGTAEDGPRGAFFITANNTGGVQLCDILATSAKDAALPDPQQEAAVFYQKYLELQKTAVLNSEIMLPLRETFRSKLTRAKSIEFLQKIATGRNIEIEDEIRGWMKDILKSDFILTVAAEVPPEEEEQEKKDALEDEIEIRLKTQFAIDPVKGKTVKQLNKGEKLVVKIVDERRTGEFLTHLLGAKKEGKDVPIVGEVLRAEEMPNERFKIVVRFGPGVYGEGWVGAAIKLKTVESEDDITPPPPPMFMGMEMSITLPVFIELLSVFLIIVLIALWGTIK